MRSIQHTPDANELTAAIAVIVVSIDDPATVNAFRPTLLAGTCRRLIVAP